MIAGEFDPKRLPLPIPLIVYTEFLMPKGDRLWIDNGILFSYRVGKDVIQYLKGPHSPTISSQDVKPHRY